jgi:serine O-acetyltransferase
MSPDLQRFFATLDASHAQHSEKILPKADAHRVCDDLFLFLFPMLSDTSRPAAVQYATLRYELIRLLTPVMMQNQERATQLIDAFFEKIPEVYQALQEDAEAILQFDPAATCREEVVATYPGFHAIAIYRIAHVLHRLGAPLLPRMFAEYLHSSTGIDIHPAATIGSSFFIDHGTGVVIGETAIIGNHVKIYQGVTLGALQVDKSFSNVKRHPTIEDHCILYASSTILGGQTVVGHHSVIGGNAWLTESVAPYSIVLHQPQVKVRSKAYEEPVNFVI